MPWGVRDHVPTHNHGAGYALYSYTVGATLSPDNQSELKFLYEADEDFSVLPSFGVIPAQVVWGYVHD